MVKRRQPRQIRPHPWGRAAVLVALTGWGREHAGGHAHEAGCGRHLVEPAASRDPLALPADPWPLP